jgi:hypothetical protein
MAGYWHPLAGLRGVSYRSVADIHALVKVRWGGPWSPKSIDLVEAIPVISKIDRKTLS